MLSVTFSPATSAATPVPHIGTAVRFTSVSRPFMSGAVERNLREGATIRAVVSFMVCTSISGVFNDVHFYQSTQP